jgi:hypothetical protein
MMKSLVVAAIALAGFSVSAPTTAEAHASNCLPWNGPHCEFAHNVRHHGLRLPIVWAQPQYPVVGCGYGGYGYGQGYGGGYGLPYAYGQQAIGYGGCGLQGYGSGYGIGQPVTGCGVGGGIGIGASTSFGCPYTGGVSGGIGYPY